MLCVFIKRNAFVKKHNRHVYHSKTAHLPSESMPFTMQKQWFYDVKIIILAQNLASSINES